MQEISKRNFRKKELKAEELRNNEIELRGLVKILKNIIFYLG